MIVTYCYIHFNYYFSFMKVQNKVCKNTNVNYYINKLLISIYYNLKEKFYTILFFIIKKFYQLTKKLSHFLK